MRQALVALGVAALLGLAATAYAAQRNAAADRVLLPSPVIPEVVLPSPEPVASASGSAREPSHAWVVETAARAGIPEAAMRAYGRASLRAPQECRLGWATLAGIGWNESHHGSIGERVLGADGRASTPIIGPALDGGPGVRAIRASEPGRAMHGDSVWEHAIGPMQFLPETWSQWEVDADGDGAADPHDLDDAAAAAAGYLCASGGDLATADGWRRAVLAYNNSVEYLRDVNAAAQTYASR